jgi:cbb3-type cytochrome c oxidase subunit III
MRANKLLLLIASLATLAVLGWAAWEENVRKEWRVLQARYKAALPPHVAEGFNIQLRQVVVPAMNTTDRCVSCHVGMAPGETPLDGDRLFGRHPQVVHEPSDYGCVVCHGGQGRATDRADAHGDAPHWPTPMIPRRYASAGCGSCHTHLEVPNQARLERGRVLFERADCLSCHRLDGRGGTLRPGGAAAIDGGDLSTVGAKPQPGASAWYAAHLEKHEKAASGPWRDSFGPLEEADRQALEIFLASRVGAPGLVESKALFHAQGCRGCHKIGGVGGDDGPDLTREGEKDPGRLDYTHVPGGRNLPAWLAEHFRAPATVVPGSAMPALGLGEPEIDALVFYMMSLRRSNLPEAYWPKDRILAERFAEREFSSDGATLYGSFCAACHGERGEGMRYPGAPPFPAIANPDFLSLASDDFIRQTVTRGRPGRRMTAWGEKEGGLRPYEIDAVVAHLRAMGGTAHTPDPKPPRWARGDVRRGEGSYQANCAACHGARGEGKEGPALSNPVLMASATDTYLVETIRRGRRNTSMPAFTTASSTQQMLTDEDIQSIVAYMRTWEVIP